MDSVEAGKRYGNAPVARTVVHLDVGLDQILPEAHFIDLWQGPLPADSIVTYNREGNPFKDNSKTEYPSTVIRGRMALAEFGKEVLGLEGGGAEVFPSKIRRVYTELNLGKKVIEEDAKAACKLEEECKLFETAKPYLLQHIRRRVLYEEFQKQRG